MCPKCFYYGLLLICWISVLTGQNSARTEAVFPIFLQSHTSLTPNTPPQFSIFDVFETDFEVINPNSGTAKVTFQVFDSAGQEVSPTGGIPLSLTVAGVRTGPDFRFGFSNKAVLGWVKLISTQPVVVQQRIAHRIERSEPGPPEVTIVSHISKPPSIAARRGIVRVRFSSGDRIWSNTGISVVYLGIVGTSAKGTLIMRNGIGENVGETGIVLPANGQAVNLFTDWFPNLLSQFPTGFGGTLEFSFDQDVFVGAIQANIFGSKEELVEPTSGTLTGSTLVSPSSSTTRSRP